MDGTPIRSDPRPKKLTAVKLPPDLRAAIERAAHAGNTCISQIIIRLLLDQIDIEVERLKKRLGPVVVARIEAEIANDRAMAEGIRYSQPPPVPARPDHPFTGAG